MVISIWSVVSGHGWWSVVGRWAVVLYYALLNQTHIN